MSAIVNNPALLPPGAVVPPRAPASPAAPAGPAGPAAPAQTGKPNPAAGAPSQQRFADVLAGVAAQGAGGLHFSRHALQRVERRGISLDASTLGRLSEGVGRAAGKGSRDSVVLVDSTAFVVSVANRTVLTAVSPEHMKEQVFTNIDSAVIA